MVKKITKFKSRNLFGETAKQEKDRLINERVKRILKGKDIRNLKADVGTTKAQRENRSKILKGKKQKIPLASKRLSFAHLK